tara:strand:- start:459 stop:755 length:297 start_codon:yes stop_codon:yes gene_type:complete
MIETVTRGTFLDWFREHRPNNFTLYGKNALFDYFEEYEEDTGEKIEFDPIAICCDYTEYENLEEYNENYEPVKNINEIRELTTVIRTDSKEGFIIQNY